jgi:hypothetical protein
LLQEGSNVDAIEPPDLLASIKARDDEKLATAYLPPEERMLSEADGVAVAYRFLSVRDRYAGKSAAPISTLPGTPEEVAEALVHYRDARFDTLSEDEQRDRWKSFERAVMDLQLFVTDEELTAIDRMAEDALDALKWRQAAVASMIRDDPNVLGNHNALRDIDVRIGEAARSYDAIRGYRDRQASGFASMLAWPIVTPIGGVIGALVAGWTVVGVGGAVGLGLAGFLFGPFWGALVGELSRLFGRLARGSKSASAHRAFEAVGGALSLGLLVGGPFVAGFALAVGAATLTPR